jgi:hypothetical protein
MFMGIAIGLVGGYMAGRHLPPVLRVLPAGLLWLDGGTKRCQAFSRVARSPQNG